MPERPVFIHGWWRSSSTYVWSKLRNDPSLICFKEPLHERLATVTLEQSLSPTRAHAHKVFRHPVVEKSYFAEYFEGDPAGPRKYSPDLAYDRYLLRPGDDDPALHAYLQSLLEIAGRARRRAVLCFCRSQMRSAWMREAFDGVHVAQVRNPADQWNSFHVQQYFLQKLLVSAVMLHRRRPRALAHIQACRDWGTPGGGAVTATLGDRDLLRVFLLFWVASTVQAITACDFTLDVDRLSTEPAYRAQASALFAKAGCEVDFSDCTTPSTAHEPAGKHPEFQSLLQEAIGALRTHASKLVVQGAFPLRDRMESLSPATIDVLRQYGDDHTAAG